MGHCCDMEKHELLFLKFRCKFFLHSTLLDFYLNFVQGRGMLDRYTTKWNSVSSYVLWGSLVFYQHSIPIQLIVLRRALIRIILRGHSSVILSFMKTWIRMLHVESRVIIRRLRIIVTCWCVAEGFPSVWLLSKQSIQQNACSVTLCCLPFNLSDFKTDTTMQK